MPKQSMPKQSMPKQSMPNSIDKPGTFNPSTSEAEYV
jgi:hypothetical protein